MLSITQEAYQDLYKRISSIKGLGDRTTMELIVSTGGGKHFQTAKQFSKYVGLAPIYSHSGWICCMNRLNFLPLHLSLDLTRCFPVLS